jgi:hypothetical protein
MPSNAADDHLALRDPCLRPLPVSEADFLSAQGTPVEHARLLAHLSGGRPGYVVWLLNDPAALSFREERLAEFRSLGSSRRVKFAAAEKSPVTATPCAGRC